MLRGRGGGLGVVEWAVAGWWSSRRAAESILTQLLATRPPRHVCGRGLLLGARAGLGAGAGARLAFAAFEDALAHLLGGGLDLLHLLSDAGAGGLVAALGLGHVVGGLHHQLLELLVFVHGQTSGGISVYGQKL